MNIQFNDLGKQWQDIEDQVYPKLDKFFNSGNYVHGPELINFETNFAKYTNSKYAIGVSNGTDALKLCLQSFEFDSSTDVIMPANTYIADAICVKHQINNQNFNITLIDCDNFFQIDTNLLKKYLIQSRHKFVNTIILPVHLYGHPSDMDTISNLAKEFDCKILEDASQSHGAISNKKMVGHYGDMTVYSLYPGKNLGAIGDAGIITTNNKYYADKLISLRNYGSPKKYYYDTVGWNNRLDTLQAIILDEKLKLLDEWNNLKIKIATKYNQLLSDIKNIQTPKISYYCDKHVYHIYCLLVENRENLQQYLSSQGIPTIIHYPVPIQQTPPFSYLNIEDSNPVSINNANKLLSLPMHPYLRDDEINHICDCIKKFYETN